jgi:hypothetical protein
MLLLMVMRLRLALVLGLACSGAAGCSDGPADREVPIPGAYLATDGSLVVESVCLPEERLEADVAEDDQTVTVTITALDYDPDNREDCLGGKTVALSAPLGERTLRDGTTGDEVPVQQR